MPHLTGLVVKLAAIIQRHGRRHESLQFYAFMLSQADTVARYSEKESSVTLRLAPAHSAGSCRRKRRYCVTRKAAPGASVRPDSVTSQSRTAVTACRGVPWCARMSLPLRSESDLRYLLMSVED
jgi:hypothetical protein